MKNNKTTRKGILLAIIVVNLMFVLLSVTATDCDPPVGNLGECISVASCTGKIVTGLCQGSDYCCIESCEGIGGACLDTTNFVCDGQDDGVTSPWLKEYSNKAPCGTSTDNDKCCLSTNIRVKAGKSCDGTYPCVDGYFCISGTCQQDTEAPTTSASLDSGTYDPPQTITLTATDPQGLSTTIHYTTNGNDPTEQSPSYAAPIQLQAGADTILKFFAVDEADNAENPLEKTYTINPAVNHPPEFDSISNQNGFFGEEISFTVSATDPDNDTLTYSVTNLDNSPTIDSQTGEFTWTPQNSQPPVDAILYSAYFKVDDGTVEIPMTVRIDVYVRHYELEVTVYEQGTTNGIDGATVKATSVLSSCTVSGDKCTLVFGKSPGIDEFDVSKDGYQTKHEQVTFTQGNYQEAVTVYLAHLHPVSLDVTVENSEGNKIGNADVTIVGTSFSCKTARWGSSKGTCTISDDLPEGNYDVIAEKSGLFGMGDYYADTEQINVDNTGAVTPDPLSFVLANVELITVTFSVDAKDSNTNPVESVSVKIDDYYENNVHQIDGDLCTTDAQGACTKQVTIEKDVTITFTATNDLYQDSTSQGAYSNDGATETISFSMNPQTVTISGKVVQQQNTNLPVTGAEILFDGVEKTTTGTDGTFSFDVDAPDVIDSQTHSVGVVAHDFDFGEETIPQKNTFTSTIDLGDIELTRKGDDYNLQLAVKDSVTQNNVNELDVYLDSQQIADNIDWDYSTTTQLQDRDYTLKITKDGYNDYTQTIDTTTPTPINVQLVNLAPHYELTVAVVDQNDVGIDGATVTIDSNSCTVSGRACPTPFDFGTTNPGTVRFDVSASGYESKEGEMTFTQNYQEAATVELEVLHSISFEVKILTTDNNTGIKNANVEITKGTKSYGSCKTDDQGACTIQAAVKADTYEVSAEKDPLLDVGGWWSYQLQTKTIKVDEQGQITPTPPLVFNLVKQGIEFVKIMFNINTLISDVLVKIDEYYTSVPDNPLKQENQDLCTTGADGTCSKEVDVEKNKARTLTASHSNDLYEQPDPSSKTTSVLSAQGTEDVEFTMTPKKVTIQGKVVEEGTDYPVFGAEIYLTSDLSLLKATTGNDGSFSFDVDAPDIIGISEEEELVVTHDYFDDGFSGDISQQTFTTTITVDDIEMGRAGKVFTFIIITKDKDTNEGVDGFDVFLNEHPIGTFDLGQDIQTKLIENKDYTLKIIKDGYNDYTHTEKIIYTDQPVTVHVELETQHLCLEIGTCHDPSKYRCGTDENGYEDVYACDSGQCCRTNSGPNQEEVFAREGTKCGEDYKVNDVGVECIDMTHLACQSTPFSGKRCKENEGPYKEIVFLDEQNQEITSIGMRKEEDSKVFIVHCKSKHNDERVFCEELSAPPVISPSGALEITSTDTFTGPDAGRKYTISFSDSFKTSDPPRETAEMHFTAKGAISNQLIIENIEVVVESIKVVTFSTNIKAGGDGTAVNVECTYKDGTTKENCDFDSVTSGVPGFPVKKPGENIIWANPDVWFSIYEKASDADKQIYEQNGIEVELTFKKGTIEHLLPHKVMVIQSASFCTVDETSGRVMSGSDDCICPDKRGVSTDLKYKEPNDGGDGHKYCQTQSCTGDYTCVDPKDPDDTIQCKTPGQYISGRPCATAGFWSRVWTGEGGKMECCEKADKPEKCESCYVSGSDTDDLPCECGSDCKNSGEVIYDSTYDRGKTCGGLSDSRNVSVKIFDECGSQKCPDRATLIKEFKIPADKAAGYEFYCECGLSCEYRNRYLESETTEVYIDCGRKTKYTAGLLCGDKCKISDSDKKRGIQTCLCPAYCTNAGVIEDGQTCGKARPWQMDLSLRGLLKKYAGPIDPRAVRYAEMRGWTEQWQNWLEEKWKISIDGWTLTPLEQHVCGVVTGKKMGEVGNFTRYPHFEQADKVKLSYAGTRAPVTMEFPDVTYYLAAEKTDKLADNTTTIQIEWKLHFRNEQGRYGLTLHRCGEDCNPLVLLNMSSPDQPPFTFVRNAETDERINASVIYESGTTINKFTAINTMKEWDYVCLLFQTRYSNSKYKCLLIVPEDYTKDTLAHPDGEGVIPFDGWGNPYAGGNIEEG